MKTIKQIFENSRYAMRQYNQSNNVSNRMIDRHILGSEIPTLSHLMQIKGKTRNVKPTIPNSKKSNND